MKVSRASRLKYFGLILKGSKVSIETQTVLRPSIPRPITLGARLSILEEIYLFREATAVRRFLQPHLAKHFGPAPQVALEVVSDPEANGAKQLFAYIRTTLPVEAAMAQLDLLDEEWFLGQLDRVNGLFNFNLESV
jgi:hypothetical protein